MASGEATKTSRRWFHLEAFNGWAICQGTFRSTEDRMHSAYFIVNEEGTRCSIVHNDIPLGSFAVCPSVSFEGNNEVEDDFEGNYDSLDSDNTAEELDGIDLDSVDIVLSEDGMHVGFAGFDDGRQFVAIDSNIIHTELTPVGICFASNGRICLAFEAEDGQGAEYHLDGRVYPGALSSYSFTDDGKHFVALVRENANDCRMHAPHRLCINGETVLDEFVPQLWGEGEEALSCEDYQLLLDSHSRAVLFGSILSSESAEEEPRPTVYTYYFDSERLVRHEGISIILVDNSKSEDAFEILGLTQEDEFRRPKKILLRHAKAR